MDFPKSVPGVGLVAGRYVDEDQTTGQPGTLITAKWMNAVTDELLGVIRAAGLEPDEEDSSQLQQALQARHDTGRLVFSAAGVTTWQVPDVLRLGLKKARVRGVGGAGGAARRSVASLGTYATGGAGAGGFDVLVDLSGVTSVPITVGAAGVVGALDTAGTGGGATSFGVFASAGGGAGGLINGNIPVGSTAVSSVAGAVLVSGGSPGATVANSVATGVYGGAGGGSMLGVGGSASASGVDGAGYGAGAGASVNGLSPLSKGGVVIVEW